MAWSFGIWRLGDYGISFEIRLQNFFEIIFKLFYGIFFSTSFSMAGGKYFQNYFFESLSWGLRDLRIRGFSRWRDLGTIFSEIAKKNSGNLGKIRKSLKLKKFQKSQQKKNLWKNR